LTVDGEECEEIEALSEDPCCEAEGVVAAPTVYVEGEAAERV
jgi:hypothetical protein